MTAKAPALRFYGLQLPALVEHEWRALESRFEGRRFLPRVVIAGIVVTLLMLMFESGTGYVPAGGLVFKGLFVPTAVVLLCFGRGVGAKLVEHRRNQMLGLVFLSGAKPHHVFLAQISARIAAAIYLALALLPCLCISILYGGASKERCVAAALFLVVEVLFLVATEFLGPALTTDSGAAGLIANITGVTLALWPWAVDRLSGILSGSPMPHWIYFFSPVSAFLQVLSGFTNAAQFRDFLLTCAIVTAMSAAALFFSAWALTHTWREEDHPFLRFRIVRRTIYFARHAQRQWAKILRPTIETNPLLWYAAYDLRNVRYAWATVVVTVGLWFAGLAAWGKGWLVPGIFYLAAATLIYGVRLQMILRVASRFSDSRHNQYFDSILAANHSPDTIIEAEETAVFLQFQTIAWVVRALTLLLVIAPVFLRKWTQITLLEHIVLSATLLWASILRPRNAIARTMWIALNTGAGVSAVFRRSSFPIANFGFQFYRIISTGASHLGRFPSGGYMENILVFILCPVVVIAASNKFERRAAQCRTVKNFRAILQAPLRSPKEIAKWDTKEPLM